MNALLWQHHFIALAWSGLVVRAARPEVQAAAGLGEVTWHHAFKVSCSVVG